MIKTDIIIIGAGPVGLFTIFEAGLMKLHCHVIDISLGGQLKEIYLKNPSMIFQFSSVKISSIT